MKTLRFSRRIYYDFELLQHEFGDHPSPRDRMLKIPGFNGGFPWVFHGFPWFSMTLARFVWRSPPTTFPLTKNGAPNGRYAGPQGRNDEAGETVVKCH